MSALQWLPLAMRLVTKIAAGILLGIGIPITTMATVELLHPPTSSTDREGTVAALILFGLPPTALGSWLIWNGLRHHQRQNRDRLQAAFFRLLKQTNGRITPLGFAMETGLSGEDARVYLDERAREFGVSFDVDEAGNIFYQFSLEGSSQLPVASSLAGSTAQGRFDVVLETVPTNRKIDAIKAIRDLTGLGLKEAKDLVEAVPVPLLTQVSATVADRSRRSLEAIGATVTITTR